MHPLWMAVPVLVWAAHFTLIYGVTSLACARSAAPLVPWAVTAASLAAAAALAATVRPAMRCRQTFAGWMTIALALASLVAIGYETSAVYLVPSCF